MNRPLLALALIPLAALGAACSGDAPPAAPKPAAATVQQPRTEADLTTVTLSPEAAKRLAIETALAAVETVSNTRTLGGEVVVPEGRAVVVSAPVAGTLVAAGAVRAGSRVRAGEAIFRLVPLASSERDQRIEGERAAAAAQAEEQAARQRLERVEQLLKDGAASVRSVEEARAQYEVATAAAAASRDRLAGLARNPIGPRGEMAIAAPFAGLLQTVSAAEGQTVAAGAPLFEVAQIDRLWVRVPVYAGDADHIDVAQPAAVTSLDAGGPPLWARRVAAPLTANPSAASIDFVFELPAGTPGAPGSDALRPGQRVTVHLPLKSVENGLVIPDSAVLFDIHGTAGVYEDLGNHAYARRRVDLARLVGSKAIISRGISAGTRVVTVGAAELFGTEFGAGK